MIIRSLRDVDLLYALFLGRLPENNFVRHDNIGRPMLDAAKAAIASGEFAQSVLERFLQVGELPHRHLSVKMLPDVLQLIAEAQLAPPQNGAAIRDWPGTLGRVLAAEPFRQMVEAQYAAAGRQFITRLTGVAPANQPEQGEPRRAAEPAEESLIVSGVEIVADAVCRGWIVDQQDPDRLLHVKIKLNGRTVTVVPANEFRRDVQELYGGGGRAGFTVRLDLLPDAPYLSRGTVEIVELARGTVVLPVHVVEFSPMPAIRAEAELRDELMRLRQLLDRLHSACPSLPGSEWTTPLHRAVQHVRARLDWRIGPIREELSQLRSSLDRLDQSLPSLAHEQGWALPFYSAVRPLLQPVIPPPKALAQASFSVVIIEDFDTAAAAKATLASVLAQTRKPDEVFLISSAATPLAAAAALDAVEIVRPEAERSATAAVNSLAERMTGSHLVILHAGVTLAAEALAWFEAAITRTNAVIVYTDEEIRAYDESGWERLLPLFRPAFDYDLLLQRNYIGEAFCIGRQAYIELEGLSSDASLDAHYDLLFRVLARFGRAAFMHLPQLLVCRPGGVLQTQSALVRDRMLRTVERHLERIGNRARVVAHADAIGRSVSDAVKILWPEDRTTPISAIVLTRDSADMVFALMSSLRRHAANWDLIEVIVVVNGRLDSRSRFAFAEIESTFDHARIIYREVPFNWAEINNTAVREISGDTLLAFLNDDMVCLTDHWDTRLRSQLARPEIGVVGGRLLYPNGALQHAGIAFAADGMTAHEAMGDAAEDGLYLDRTLLVHETGAVTGAFFACRRELFDALGGFDAQRYAITSSDADFCVRVRASGKGVIYDPFLAWIHYESVSRGQDAHEFSKQLRADAEHEVWRSRFSGVDRLDLSVNPHLARSVRPFVAFNRTDKEAIELWFQAQMTRCARWERATAERPAGFPS